MCSTLVSNHKNDAYFVGTLNFSNECISENLEKNKKLVHELRQMISNLSFCEKVNI